jgi:short-subunit dehydrogenase
MAPKLKPLAKQVIVITGASSGIGLTTARKAAAAGAKIFLIARDEAALKKAVRGIQAAGGTADYAVADVGEEEQVRAAADKAIKRFGGFDTWVNDAGVGIYAALTRTPTNEHARLFKTNYWGVVFGSLAAVQHLKRRGGALITVASGAADIPSPLMGAYTASKHAVAGFIDTLRIELLADKAPVSVTLIKPAGIGTPFARHAMDHLRGEARIPPPVYSPELVADAILDAAENPTRELVVGGAGRLQMLFATIAPGLFTRLAPMFIPMMSDEHAPKTKSSSLFAPAGGDEERSEVQPGRAFSVYTAAEMHPRIAMGLGLLAGLAVAAAVQARRA